MNAASAPSSLKPDATVKPDATLSTLCAAVGDKCRSFALKVCNDQAAISETPRQRLLLGVSR